MTEFDFVSFHSSSANSGNANSNNGNSNGDESSSSNDHQHSNGSERAASGGDGPTPPLHPEVFLKIRLLIHTLQVGAVIGRGGERIKNLRKDYNAVIEVVSDSENQIPERIVTMSATIKNLLGILNELIPFLNENQPSSLRHSHGGDSDSFAVRLLVHYVVAGSVIGTGGANIRELRKSSCATITVFHDCCPSSSDRVILAAGSLDAIMKTLASVLDTIAETDVRGQTYPYNPFQAYDHRRVVAYGGFPMLDPYGGGGSEVAAGRGRGRFFDGGSYGPSHGGHRVPPPPPPLAPQHLPISHQQPPRGMKRRRVPEPLVQPLLSEGAIPPPLVDYDVPHNENMQKSARYSNGGSGVGYPPHHMPPSLMAPPYSHHPHHLAPPFPPSLPPPMYTNSPNAYESSGPNFDTSDPPPLLPHVPPLLPQQPVQSTEQYTIPPEAAGAVIGPRGSRAHFVRQSTGCRVTISDDITKSGNRVITLTGTQSQLDAAKHHMRSFLAEFYRAQPQETFLTSQSSFAADDNDNN